MYHRIMETLKGGYIILFGKYMGTVLYVSDHNAYYVGSSPENHSKLSYLTKIWIIPGK